MQKITKYILISVSLFSADLCYAQTRIADSLLLLIKSDKADTNKVNHLNSLAIELWGNLDTAITCSSKALETAHELNGGAGWLKGMGRSNYLLGVFYFDKGNFTEALMHNTEALKIWEQLEKTVDAKELNQVKFAKAKSIGEIGNAYYGQGNYPKALESQLRTLKLHEELKHEKGIGNTLGNIGNIYSDQKEYSKALEYFNRSLKVGRKLGNKYDMSIDLRNIASVYKNMGNNSKALEYSMMALVVSRELGNDLEIASNLSSVGSAIQTIADSALLKGRPYSELKEEYEKSMDYYLQSLKLNEEQGNLYGSTFNLSNIAGVYLVQKNYKEAEAYFLRALAIDSALGSVKMIRYAHEGLSELYYSKGDYKRSLEHFKLASYTKDSLFNEEKDKEITKHELNYEFEKKEAALKAEQEKKEALAEVDKKRQDIFFWLIVSVAAGIALIALIVFRALRVTRKQKQIIEEQKEIVEEKQREVLDSIHYAKRIQQSLLPTEKYIEKQISRLKKH